MRAAAPSSTTPSKYEQGQVVTVADYRASLAALANKGSTKRSLELELNVGPRQTPSKEREQNQKKKKQYGEDESSSSLMIVAPQPRS